MRGDSGERRLHEMMIQREVTSDSSRNFSSNFDLRTMKGRKLKRKVMRISLTISTLIFFSYLFNDPTASSPLLSNRLPDQEETLGSSKTVEVRPYDLTKTHPREPDSSSVRFNRSSFFSKNCYRYSGVSAENTCCLMLDYAIDGGKNLLDCASKSVLDRYSQLQKSVVHSCETEFRLQ